MKLLVIMGNCRRRIVAFQRPLPVEDQYDGTLLSLLGGVSGSNCAAAVAIPNVDESSVFKIAFPLGRCCNARAPQVGQRRSTQLFDQSSHFRSSDSWLVTNGGPQLRGQAVLTFPDNRTRVLNEVHNVFLRLRQSFRPFIEVPGPQWLHGPV